MHKTPAPLISQPIKAFAPSGARLTGSMKMPAPMMVPTTSADVIQMPMSWLLPSPTIRRFSPADLAYPCLGPRPRRKR